MTKSKSKQVQVHQVFDSRYYDGAKMQRILENLFPERKGHFGLRMTNDQWAFSAPRQVTRNELEVISTGAGVSEEERTGAEVHQFSTLEQVQSHFSRTEILEQPYHFISICQRQSWKPLQVTKPMLSFLVDKFKLKPSIWDVASCFYAKDFDVESTLCVPFTQSRNGPITVPKANKAVATWIEELTEAEYRHLTDLAYLESRLLQILALLGSSDELLEGLSSLCRNWYPDSAGHDRESAVSGLTEFQNHQLKCRAYVRTAEYLQKLTEKNTQLLANTLSFREQLYAKAQNDNMLRLNKSAVFITTLTLLYLPASFAATFFGMNFFDLDDSGDHIVMTSMIWIYFLSSAGLTIGTFLLYHVLLDKTLIRRIVGNIPIVETLMHGKSGKGSSDMELGSLE
ncbi:zinc transport [Fusarium napiforme]|uniref:Zinc transport n=1 Tax=Fusarium napiforme TaxID=42672 RepID=A0A8H5IMV5_9HYPO|nr:zinc transport [Fusarium napiforme]